VSQTSIGRKTSVIVPAFNEAENMPDLFSELAKAFHEAPLEAEIILVDDGSTDGTLEAARQAATSSGLEDVRFLTHRSNRGKTEALLTGAEAASGDYLVLFDADLQHAPAEIVRFVQALDSGYDLVTGRKIGHYEKRLVSGMYNRLSRLIFRVPVHDLNSMKAFRREVIEELELREDWHRYLVVLAHERGFRLGEIDIPLYPRRHGHSKYSGRSRILIGSLDLVAVWFQLVFGRKPLLFFGMTGLALLGLGALTGALALYLRFGLGQGYRPLLTLVLLLVLVGLGLFVLGFLAELIAGLRSEVEALRRDLRR
jgi:glycosyltransferase involved in cell wall biosynthesis